MTANPLDRVVILHGIVPRTAASMSKLEQAIGQAGFETLNLDYPSRTADLAQLAELVHAHAVNFISQGGGQTHFVTHSMGGLLARTYIALHRPAALGRVIMLAPPNQGSELADLLGGNVIYKRYFGPAGQQLRTRPSQNPDSLGLVDYPLGIIAGDRSIDPLSWLLLPRPNDGRVSVARTRLEGMAAHITIHATHAFIMRNDLAIRQTIHFLRHGIFRP